MAGRFPNGIAVMIKLLRAVVPSIDWAGYCQLTPTKQFTWEEQGYGLNKSMLFLMNVKNNNAKKDLYLAYFQE